MQELAFFTHIPEFSDSDEEGTDIEVLILYWGIGVIKITTDKGLEYFQKTMAVCQIVQGYDYFPSGKILMVDPDVLTLGRPQ